MLRLVFSNHFLLFGYPDEPLFLVFDIVHNQFPTYFFPLGPMVEHDC